MGKSAKPSATTLGQSSSNAIDAEMVHDEGLVDDEDLQFSTAGPSTFDSTKFEPSNGDDAGNDDEDDAIMIDADSKTASHSDSVLPSFPPLSTQNLAGSTVTKKSETRRIPIPPHRMSPLKKDWVNIFGPLTELLGLQVRMNVQRKSVEIRVRGCARFTNISSYQTFDGYRLDVKTHQRNRCAPKRRRLCKSLCARIRCQCKVSLLLHALNPTIPTTSSITIRMR
jgi:hypothetical protein